MQMKPEANVIEIFEKHKIYPGEVWGVTNLTPVLWSEEHVVAIVLGSVSNDKKADVSV